MRLTDKPIDSNLVKGNIWAEYEDRIEVHNPSDGSIIASLAIEQKATRSVAFDNGIVLHFNSASRVKQSCQSKYYFLDDKNVINFCNITDFGSDVHVSHNIFFHVTQEAIIVSRPHRERHPVLFYDLSSYNNRGLCSAVAFHRGSDTIFWADNIRRNGRSFVRINSFNFDTDVETIGPVRVDYTSTGAAENNNHSLVIVPCFGIVLATDLEIIVFNHALHFVKRFLLSSPIVKPLELIREKCVVGHTKDHYIIFRPSTGQLEIQSETRQYVGSDIVSGRRFYLLDSNQITPCGNDDASISPTTGYTNPPEVKRSLDTPIESKPCDTSLARRISPKRKITKTSVKNNK